MPQLRDVVINAREEANVASDAHHDAWEELQAIVEPSHEDVEKWIEVRKKFYSAKKSSKNYYGRRLVAKLLSANNGPL